MPFNDKLSTVNDLVSLSVPHADYKSYEQLYHHDPLHYALPLSHMPHHAAHPLQHYKRFNSPYQLPTPAPLTALEPLYAPAVPPPLSSLPIPMHQLSHAAAHAVPVATPLNAALNAHAHAPTPATPFPTNPVLASHLSTVVSMVEQLLQASADEFLTTTQLLQLLQQYYPAHVQQFNAIFSGGDLTSVWQTFLQMALESLMADADGKLAKQGLTVQRKIGKKAANGHSYRMTTIATATAAAAAPKAGIELLSAALDTMDQNQAAKERKPSKEKVAAKHVEKKSVVKSEQKPMYELVHGVLSTYFCQYLSMDQIAELARTMYPAQYAKMTDSPADETPLAAAWREAVSRVLVDGEDTDAWQAVLKEQRMCLGRRRGEPTTYRLKFVDDAAAPTASSDASSVPSAASTPTAAASPVSSMSSHDSKDATDSETEDDEAAAPSRSAASRSAPSRGSESTGLLPGAVILLHTQAQYFERWLTCSEIAEHAKQVEAASWNLYQRQKKSQGDDDSGSKRGNKRAAAGKLTEYALRSRWLCYVTNSVSTEKRRELLNQKLAAENFVIQMGHKNLDPNGDGSGEPTVECVTDQNGTMIVREDDEDTQSEEEEERSNKRHKGNNGASLHGNANNRRGRRRGLNHEVVYRLTYLKAPKQA